MAEQEEKISNIEIPESSRGEDAGSDTVNIIINCEAQGENSPARDISLTLRKGHSLALIGRPDLGRITFRLPVTNLEKIGITLVFQDPQSILNPSQTLIEQLIYIIRIHQHASRKVAEERADEILRKTGISKSSAEGYPHELSDEMKQRFVIAAALAHAPVLLIANETECGLDMSIKLQLLSLLKELINHTGMALLLITLDKDLALKICDDMAVLPE